MKIVGRNFFVSRRLVRLSAVLLLLAFAAGGCSHPVEGAEPQVAYRQVKEEGALLLDVRTPQEFLQNRIQGARNIPINELEQRLDEIEELVRGDRSRPIVVYCERGGRAARAREILLRAGFKRVTNLGGIRDWPDEYEATSRPE